MKPLNKPSPNKMLRQLVDKKCGVKDCKNHGVISRSGGGSVKVRCIDHMHDKATERDKLLKALGLK